MKRTYAKLTALLMILALALTGCNLLDVNQVQITANKRVELEKDYSAVLAEYDGGTVTKFDVYSNFYTMYTMYSQLYSQFGMSIDVDTANSLLESTVQAEVYTRALAAEFDRRGLTLDKTDEEIRAESDALYDSSYATSLSSTEGSTDEEKAANAEYAMYAQGMTRELLYTQYLNNYKADALQADIEDEISEITDEELQQAYDEKLAADEATYTESPSSIESAMTEADAVVAWMPSGYRTVKHILVIPEDEVKTAFVSARTAYNSAVSALENLKEELDALDEAEEDADVRTEDEIQADIDAKEAELPELEKAFADAEAACLENVKDKTDEIYAKLEAGEAFDDVMAEYGEDPGMQSEPCMTTGYYVSADSTSWDKGFTAGAMALVQVGDYSLTPAVSSSGVHIIYYNSDVTAGPVALETIRDALYAQTLETMKSSHYNEVAQSLLDGVNPVYHMDAWKLA